MDEVSLDFVRCCLCIDPGERWTAKQLLDHEIFDSEFKEDLRTKMQDWLAEEKEYLVEMQDLTKIDDTTGNSKYIPEEFCNVNELLKQLEGARHTPEYSLKQASYGALYSVGAEPHEIQEVNSEVSDSSDADVSSSGVARSRVSGFREHRVDASAGINSDLIEEMGNLSHRVPVNQDL